MAGALPDYSAVLLGSDGAVGRAASLPGAGVVYVGRLAHADVQLLARPHAHRELLDDASSSPEIVVSQSQTAPRHSSPKREPQGFHGHQLRHRFLLF